MVPASGNIRPPEQPFRPPSAGRCTGRSTPRKQTANSRIRFPRRGSCSRPHSSHAGMPPRRRPRPDSWGADRNPSTYTLARLRIRSVRLPHWLSSSSSAASSRLAARETVCGGVFAFVHRRRGLRSPRRGQQQTGRVPARPPVVQHDLDLPQKIRALRIPEGKRPVQYVEPAVTREILRGRRSAFEAFTLRSMWA